MTIAAGFAYRDGVLVCADTELTGDAIKLHASKVGYFECPAGKFGVAYAGNSGFAISTIQKCKRRLQETKPEDVLSELEKIVDKEYRKTVISDPAQAWDHGLPFQLLISFCSRTDGSVKLFVTQKTTVREVDGYECLGIGNELAHFLIRPTFIYNLPEADILSIAAFALGNVKRFVPACGGYTHFLLMRRGGETQELHSKAGWQDPETRLEWLEHRSRGYEHMARQLLYMIAHPDVTDESLALHLENFGKHVLKLRSDLKECINPRKDLSRTVALSSAFNREGE